MDKLIFVRPFDAFRQNIILGIAYRPGGSNDFMLSTTLAIDNADVLRSVD